MKFRVRTKDQTSTVVLDGNINESFAQDVAELKRELKTKRVVFDCAAVRTINSVGVGGWLTFVKDLALRHDLEFERCPVMFVHSANQLRGFLANGKVTSCQVTCTCEACGKSWEPLITLDEAHPSRDFTPSPCPSCGESTLPTELAEDYLAFMR